VELELLAHSVTAAEKYCISSFSQRDWDGNQWPNIEKEMKELEIKTFYPKEPRYQERIRGYRDQGSLRPEHQWLPMFDISLSEEFARIEKEREYFQNTLSWFLEFLLNSDWNPSEEPYLKERLRRHWSELGRYL
jgi:hypothetical protein